jgi:hypothetical protein
MVDRVRALLPCRACARHVFVGEAVCPFCGAVLDRNVAAARAWRAGGVAAALVAASCGGVSEHTEVIDAGGSQAPSGTGGTAVVTTGTGGGPQTVVLDGAVRAVGDAGLFPSDAADDADPCAAPRWDNSCMVSIYKSPPPAKSV